MSPRSVFWGWALGCAVSLAAQPSCPFDAHNESAVARTALVRVSLPFARGALPDANAVRVADRQWPAVPLVRWGDGSVAVLQAHVEVDVPAEGSQTFVATAITAPAGALASPDHVWPEALPMRTEVEDPWGRTWAADLAGPYERLPGSTERVEVRRYTGVHRRGDAAYFGYVAYLVVLRGERRAELTLLLDNGAYPRAGTPVLGHARLRRFRMRVDDPWLRARPRFAGEEAMSAPEPAEGGGFSQDLLGPSDHLYLGDRTAKAFRIDLFLDGADVPAARRERAARDVEQPVLAWPDVDATRRTGAFGGHGGPAPAPTHAAARLAARKAWLEWRAGTRLGPFVGLGDPRDAAAQGTPRNASSALHNALRWRSAKLLAVAEAQALRQTLRPTPGASIRAPRATAALRAGMSPRAQRVPHGFTALDYEHFSVDLLYDLYWLTGDPLARDEIARAGRGLVGLVERVPFMTSRGEGWCMQAAVKVARATGDCGPRDALYRRAVGRVLPEIAAARPWVALLQPPHADAFGPAERFDAPWQMAALVHGLVALWRDTEDAELADVAVDVARRMAVGGWEDGVGPKYLVQARDPGTFASSLGGDPLTGIAPLQVGAFALAAELASEEGDRRLFQLRAAEIVGAVEPAAREAHRWLQLYLDRRSDA